MTEVKFERAPWLGGWVIGAALGVVSFGAMVVVGGFDLMPAAYLGGVVAVLAGAIIGWPAPALPPLREPMQATAPAAPVEAVVRAAAPAPEPATRAAPVRVAPPPPPRVPATSTRAPATAAPASLMSAPVKAGPGPVRYDAPRGGKADDLKEIEGIGPTMEKLVNSLGFWHFDQIANWTEADVAWVNDNLANFKGRVTRDKWVNQAKIIVTEGLERFRARAKRNDY